MGFGWEGWGKKCRREQYNRGTRENRVNVKRRDVYVLFETSKIKHLTVYIPGL